MGAGQGTGRDQILHGPRFCTKELRIYSKAVAQKRQECAVVRFQLGKTTLPVEWRRVRPEKERLIRRFLQDSRAVKRVSLGRLETWVSYKLIIS